MPEFLNSKNKPAEEIPSSCIEGAEYIIQCIYNDKLHKWANNQKNKPHVMADFGGGKTIDITGTKDFHEKAICTGLADFDFRNGLKLGQGIILLNNTGKDAGKGKFNMHLGAVVKVLNNGWILSDVSDLGSVAMDKSWGTKKIFTPDDYRGPDYPATIYAIGLLRPNIYF
jgi:hypothetical protein